MGILSELTERDDEILNQAIKINGEQNQKIVAMEELSELQKEIAKDLRGNYNSYNLAEEFTDVIIMMHQLMKMYDIEKKVEIFWNYKLEKLNERNRSDDF